MNFRFRRTGCGFALTAILIAGGVAPARAELLSERDAYDQIVHAISEQLAQPDRFTRLSHNISSLSVAPDRKPLFSILAGSKPEEFKPDASRRAYIKDEGSFLVTRYGSVVATYKDQLVLQGAMDRWTKPFVVWKPDGVQRIAFPGYLGINRVFHTGLDWGFVVSDGNSTGIKLDSSTNVQVTLTNRSFSPHVIETETGIIALTRPDGPTGYETNSHLVVTVKDERGMRQSMFRDYRQVQLHFQGLLPLNDGRFVAVAKRLVVLREDAPSAATEAERKALLVAFEKQDREQFSEALRVVSEYGYDRDLDRQLQSTRDPAEAYVGIERAARSLLDDIRRSEPRRTAATNQELNLALQAHQETARDFVCRVDKVRGGELGIAPMRVVELLRGGWQYFGGYWIQHPQVRQQIAAKAIVLHLEFMDEEWNPARGVFRLDNTGRLKLLFQHERDEFTPACQFFKNEAGEELVFFPFEGLARYGGGKLEWLDRSDEMKWMERVVGCDREGRIYFGSGASIASSDHSGSFNNSPAGHTVWATTGRGSNNYWVYRPKAKPASSPIVRLFPVAHVPLMDRAGRIWFCPTIPPMFALPPAAGSLVDNPATELARRELADAPQHPMTIKVISQSPTRSFGAAEFDAKLDLFCYDHGRVYRCLTNLPLSTILLAGVEDSLIGTTQDRSDRNAFVVEKGESATLATDLHDLAIKDFALLSRAAPLDAEPPGFDYQNEIIHPINCNPSLCRVDDRLWINDHDQVEVYRDGKSLGFQMKLTIPSRNLVLLGPLTNAAGKRMLICNPGRGEAFSSSQGATLVWAAASGEGELLGVDRVPTITGQDGPLFNRAKGIFHVADVSDRSWQVSGPNESNKLHTAGSPVLALKDGDWVAQGAAPYSGYRVVTGERLEDIPVACERPLVLLAETDDERLLCATPEGLVWLKRKGKGQFKVSEELPLHVGGYAFSYIGQDGDNIYLTLSDARRQAYLAVIEKKSQPH